MCFNEICWQRSKNINETQINPSYRMAAILTICNIIKLINVECMLLELWFMHLNCMYISSSHVILFMSKCSTITYFKCNEGDDIRLFITLVPSLENCSEFLLVGSLLRIYINLSVFVFSLFDTWSTFIRDRGLTVSANIRLCRYFPNLIKSYL